jgi:hypothetical protein
MARARLERCGQPGLAQRGMRLWKAALLTDDSLHDGFARPLANGGWKIESEGREVDREEKVGLGIWDRACYHCRSGRNLGSASQDGEVGDIVLIMNTDDSRQSRGRRHNV